MSGLTITLITNDIFFAMEKYCTQETEEEYKNLLLQCGKKFHELRVAKNLYISFVAKAINVSTAKIKKIEDGQTNFTVGTLCNLCKLYKISPKKFFEIVRSSGI